MTELIEDILISELTTSVRSEVVEFAASLINSFPKMPLGVLFYGSVLRKADPEGILDFYIITESNNDFKGNTFARVGNVLLPPNVNYAEFKADDGILWRAKIAVISAEQFKKRNSLSSLDSTLWARFCQPVRLVWVRDASAADIILNLIIQSVTTASCWAALLGSSGMTAIQYWQNLFAHTYESEVRVEQKGRGNSLIKDKEERFSKLLLLGWKRAHLNYAQQKDYLQPLIPKSLIERAYKRWGLIRRTGKTRNIARLIKASFTFEGGGDYLAWKIKRHAGIDLKLSSFEAKHPLIMLPFLLWRMYSLRKAK
ncbi:hypothetical protein [Swingsia samuiensis]|uniref:Uncharacterized protein n=1 Tax=Swingsia samuiensis TaxID=1293412 RepID=A0A4Y6UMY7_9PROT|nr:hypothetical protein [Swingsia samuiensis]QDH17717.1 hypothetical protein E3D00_09165 [Swingsia samuiensis]